MQGQVSLTLLHIKGKIHFIPDQRFDHGDPYPEPATWTQDEEHLAILFFLCLGLFGDIPIYVFFLYKYVGLNKSTKTISGKLHFTRNISILSHGNLTFSKYAQCEPSCNVCVVQTWWDSAEVSRCGVDLQCFLGMKNFAFYLSHTSLLKKHS